jgi:hypothetical protein
MPADRPPRQRTNTVNTRLTPTPADWLLAQYDAAGSDEMAYRTDDEDGNVVLPIYTLKSLYEPGESMRVTASDYGDPCRWWL